MPNFTKAPVSAGMSPSLYTWVQQQQNFLNKNQPLRNQVLNGGCSVNQRPTAALGVAMAYGSCDRFKAGVLAGGVTAGTITRTTSSLAGRTGNALHISGASLNTSPLLVVETYIEAKDAVAFKNTVCSFAARVYHDVGITVQYTLQVSVATGIDNFAAVTVIKQAAYIVESGGATPLVLNDISMGDSSNGVHLRIYASPGDCVTKNFHYTEIQFIDNPTITPFLYKDFSLELAECKRYYQKSFNYETAPAQSAGAVGAPRYTVQTAGANPRVMWTQLSPAMRVTPTTSTYYNPAAANGNWRNATLGADSGAAGNSGLGSTGFGMNNPQVAGDAVGNIIQIHWTQDADF